MLSFKTQLQIPYDHRMRILIVKLGAIGDLVHTLPALAALRQAHPSAYLAWAVERGAAAQLLHGNPYLDELIELDLQGWRRSLTTGRTRGEIGSVIAHLRQARFEVSIDFQGLLKSALVPWLARVPRRFGFAFDSLREPASGLLLTERVAVNDDDHVIRKNLRLVEAAGCDISSEYQFPIQADTEDRRYVEEQVREEDGDFAILNPGGGWATKLWDPQRFAHIADHLWQHKGVRSIITYGPGERGLADQINGLCRTGETVVLKTSLKQFFLLARRARLFVGGDTGPMHIAAAAGTPIVALFGPTSSRRNGPFEPADIVIERGDLECRVDCYRRRCDHCSCMDLPTEMVWRGIVTRLEREERRSGRLAASGRTWASSTDHSGNG
ncbi:MAG: glycosyltransferase family 9 protein [Acidobacteriota bacterium]